MLKNSGHTRDVVVDSAVAVSVDDCAIVTTAVELLGSSVLVWEDGSLECDVVEVWVVVATVCDTDLKILNFS